MFGPWIACFGWLRQHIPKKLPAVKPNVNFIMLHYTYIISMALLGSIILIPGGSMPYIDALFFASGSATQSGLNTVDVNKIKLYQQVVLMLIASICNPIFVHSFVVFVRLYWFEKRFQNVVVEARSLRRNKTLSRRKSEAKPDTDDRDLSGEEEAVGDREIVVLRQPDGAARGRKIEEDDNAFVFAAGESESSQSRERSSSPSEPISPTDQGKNTFSRDIMFADELSRTRTPEFRVPERRSKEHSIEFVQNQRNPKDRGTLRIPGPRDFDRGFMPERIEEGDEELEKETTNEDEGPPLRRHRSSSPAPQEFNEDDHPLKTHITIDTPRPPRRTATGPSAPSAYNRGRRLSNGETDGPAPHQHLRNRGATRSLSRFLTKSQTEERDPMPYLSWTPTVGRNSAFIDLTEEQREELGGIEYRSLKLLAIILVFYYVGFHLLGMVCLLPWINRDKHYSQVVRDVGVNPSWWGIFTPASMFNDLGLTLTPDSMISFHLAPLPLILGTFLIIIGNTGFPCMLRFIIWLTSKCVPIGSGVWEELRFLLDHPRRCFTLLFPSKANWWLFWVLVLLNGIDTFLFIILDLNNPTVTSIPGGYRFLDGLFQAAATRTAGFAIVNISALHPATQVSYLIMMYISIFPIAISTRQTNVYEEKSLGVYSAPSDDDDPESPNAKTSYVSTHLRRQLSFDLWFVFLGFFLIAIIEGNRLENTNDYTFTLFSVLFEIISAYGTVGLSLGYPGINASFSAEFKTLSKLIIIAMQIRGRHRGLPYAVDRAILLPSETLHKKEDEDAARRTRRASNIDDLSRLDSAPDGPGNFGITQSNTATTVGANNLRRVGTGGTTLRGRGLDTRNLTRILSGALSAGPTTPVIRDKRA